MTKYQVTVLFDASAMCEVDADDPHEAAAKAEDLLEGRQHLCHQCAHELDTGDAYGVLVYDESDAKVLDTRRDAELIRELQDRIVELEAELAKKGGAA